MHSGLRSFDRAHFKAFGDYALLFELVYWIQDPDYTVYMGIQQAINLNMFKQFSEAGIEFADPAQTLMMQMQNDSVKLSWWNYPANGGVSVISNRLPREP